MEFKPSLQEFIRLTRKGNLIPVYAEFLADLETPVLSFKKLGTEKYRFLLESVEGGLSQGRYSFLGHDPMAVIRVQNGVLSLTEGDKTKNKTFKGDPLVALKSYLAKYKTVRIPGLPRFAGGAVGMIAYDCNRFYEKVSKKKRVVRDEPDLFFMIADTLVVFDHVARTIKVLSNAYVDGKASPGEKKKIYALTVDKIIRLVRRLKSPPGGPASGGANKVKEAVFTSNFTKAGFIRAVNKIKVHIKKGDVIQTVLSQRFQTELNSEPFDIYRALRSINPSPYMFFLDCGDYNVIGSSPETHVRSEDGRLTLKPIAGTRPRGKNEAEDELLSRELIKDPKERAEHVMLVDLGRNDLGRVSKTGSVKASQLMLIEKYSHVMHIVSQVTGELDPKFDVYDVIRATFPAGTVSGAPKVRSMQIIDELEPTPRGPYAGLVGYLGFSGNFDSCITIRTMTTRSGTVTIQAGAGIVADSKPETEWMETRNKARGLFKAVRMAGRGLE